MLRNEIEAEAFAGLGIHDAAPREIAPAEASATWQAARQLQFVPLQLCGLSLGQTQAYTHAGGLRVFSDDSTLLAPHDLARELTRLESGRPSGRVVAAFPVGAGRDLTIRVILRGVVAGQRSLQIRARCAGAVRVPETWLMVGPGGVMDVELPVVGLSFDQVATHHECWTWEYRTSARGDFAPFGGHGIEIRIYVTAGVPVNSLPLESYYHVACAVGGAQTPAEAERAVWMHVCRHRLGSYVTNAAGEPLTFWLPDDSVGLRCVAYAARGAQVSVRSGDSSCKGWSALFREALAIHSIRAQLWILGPDLGTPGLDVPSLLAPDGKGGQTALRGVGLLVKGFVWGEPTIDPARPDAEGDVVAPGAFRWKLNMRRDERCAVWRRPDVARMVGTGHMGRQDGMFSEHAVVAVQRDGRDIIYDPTFGLGPHDTLAAYQRDLMGEGEDDAGGLCAIVGYRPVRARDPVTGQMRSVGIGGLLAGACRSPAVGCLKLLCVE